MRAFRRPLFIGLSLAALASTGLAADFPVTVESCDREITFTEPPARAVSNDVNLTEMMLVLGLTDRMVGYTGISGWSKLDAQLRDGVAELPELAERYPSREVLVGADADFYFAGWNYGMRVGGDVTPETLAPYGIAVYELTESCIHINPDKSRAELDDLYNDLLNLGRIFGVPDRADALIAGYRARLTELTEGVAEAEPLRVFVYDSGEDAPFTAGAYAMPTAMIEAAGGTNIMDDLDKSWATIGWEPVIDRDPEVIIIVNYGEVTAVQKKDFLRQHNAFADITAVRNDQFVVLDYVAATPGPRNIEAVGRLIDSFASARAGESGS